MLKPIVEVRDTGGLLVAEFWDCLRLDPAPVQDLRKKFEEHLRRKGKSTLIVDLNGVGFAGSAALGGFLALQKVARQQGGRVIFCNVDPTVKEVFRVSKLDTLFLFTPDLPSALAKAEAPESPSSEPDPKADGAAPSLPASSPPPLRRGRDRKA